jgi:hypothetical protein
MQERDPRRSSVLPATTQLHGTIADSTSTQCLAYPPEDGFQAGLAETKQREARSIWSQVQEAGGG